MKDDKPIMRPSNLIDHLMVIFKNTAKFMDLRGVTGGHATNTFSDGKGGTFKGNQRKERKQSRRRKMKSSAR